MAGDAPFVVVACAAGGRDLENHRGLLVAAAASPKKLTLPKHPCQGCMLGWGGRLLTPGVLARVRRELHNGELHGAWLVLGFICFHCFSLLFSSQLPNIWGGELV